MFLTPQNDGILTEAVKCESAQGAVLLEQLSATMPTGKPNVPKKKPGPRSYKDKARLPKRSRIDKKIRFKLNQKRDSKTLAADRYGVSLMWKHAEAEMKAARILPMGSYDENNIHGGKIWGWKHECNLTNEKVKRILYQCIHCGEMTEPQLRVVRKSLSYAYQLVHSGRDDFPVKRILHNWPSVFNVWNTIDEDTLKKVTTESSTLPERIPTYEEMKTAFTKGWTPDHPWTFLKFTAGCLSAYDCFVCGPRPEEDIDRIKRSLDHVVVPGEGQMSTGYDGGRCKTDVKTPWRLWTVCFCPGKHQSPGLCRLENGNPREPLSWCSTCPLACFEFLQSFKNAKGKRYCKINKHGTDVMKTNEGDVVKFATQWMISQGVCPENSPYSHNSGRRSLARLLSECKVSYEDGFEVHADKWQNWQTYQNDCRWSSFDRRHQSTNPDVACRALRIIARKFGRGVIRKTPLNMTQRYMHNFLKVLGHGKLANRIREGLPDSDDEQVIPPSSMKRVKTEPTEAASHFKPIQVPPMLVTPSKKPAEIDWKAISMPPLPALPQLKPKARRRMMTKELAPLRLKGPKSRRLVPPPGIPLPKRKKRSPAPTRGPKNKKTKKIQPRTSTRKRPAPPRARPRKRAKRKI